MPNADAKSSLSGFAFYLSENKYLERQAALDALNEANSKKISYIDFLVKQKLLDAHTLTKATSEHFGIPRCDLSAISLENIPAELLNIQVVKKRYALPLFLKNNCLYLAVTDPTIENLYDLRFLTGYDTRLVITDGSQLARALDEFLNRIMVSEIGESSGDEEVITLDTYQEDLTNVSNFDVESAPVINYVNKIIIDAIEKGASDIHFERYDNDYRIRYRVYGVLHAVATPPIKLASYLLARIKIMANLDITEHRVPQDGRFKMNLSKYKSIDFRVSVCPTLFGEKVVLRLLDPSSIFHSMDQLGMEEYQKEILLNALSHTQGIIIVTGPTGSGKTVTLYSALSHLNSSEDNIMTVEDPVEIPMQGINQVHVNPKVGLTFAAALRSFLRQDPDIIMVGEIRDLETAQISVQASQTGHLVLSTLHTNTAPESITRLMNIGVEPYNIASSLVLVIAQRLLRVLCHRCKKKEVLSDEVLLSEGFQADELKELVLYKAEGCNHCSFGYSGRTGIYEMMPVSQEMAYLVMRGGTSIEVSELAKKEGVKNLRQSGLEKVKRGITSLAELNRTFR